MRVEYSDVLIETWADIGRFLGMPERTVRRRKARLLAGRYAFFRKRRRGEKEVVCAWDSSLIQYIEDCGQKGIVP